MEIIKYAGHTCPNCRKLDKVLSTIELPCEVNTRYVEDDGQDVFMSEGVMTLPTLLIKGSNNHKVLTGAISPKQVKDAIEELNN